jgi:hypothetical protein
MIMLFGFNYSISPLHGVPLKLHRQGLRAIWSKTEHFPRTEFYLLSGEPVFVMIADTTSIAIRLAHPIPLKCQCPCVVLLQCTSRIIAINNLVSV